MRQRVTAADRARQAVASAILLTATLGVPAALSVLVGWPLPASLNAASHLPSVLSQPVASSVVVDVLAVVAWAAWLHFTAGILVEVVNATTRRGRPQLRLPFGGPSHELARSLVVAALLAGATTPFTPAALAPAAWATSIPATATHDSQPGSAAADLRTSESEHHAGLYTVGSPAAAPGVGATVRATPAMVEAAASVAEQGDAAPVYVVSAPAAGQYDCLWDIAEEQLGDGTRWTEIYHLNAGRTQPDGDTLTDPDLIRPGWRLRLPPDAHLATETRQPARSPSTPDSEAVGIHRSSGHVVAPGDTLWEIAEDKLGDGARYGELAAAAATLIQPDGRTLQDPDLLHPGWTIPIPDTTPTTEAMPAPNRPPAPAGDRQPGPAPEPAPTPAPHESAPSQDADQPPRLEYPTTAGEEQATPESRPDQADAASRATTAATDAPAQTDIADADADAEDDAASPGWVLPGLSGAGTMLAGALLLLLRQRRRGQARLRRPGRTLAVPPPQHAMAEKSVLAHATTATTIQWLDQLLRRLAAARALTGESLPAVAAVSLDRSGVTLHLAYPSELPGPWTTTPDPLHWHLPRTTDLDRVGPLVPDQPAPIPLLATVGAAPDGSSWLLNLEQYCAATVTGDRQRGHDLLRYVAAELGCNPWADGVRVHCVGVAEELGPLNPDRLSVSPGATSDQMDDPADSMGVDGLASAVDPVAGLVGDAVATVDRSTQLGIDVPNARIRQAADETWPPRVLLIDGTRRPPALNELTALVNGHPSHTGTAVLVLADTNDGPADSGRDSTILHISGDGHLTLPGTTGTLTADGLTATGLSSEEARGCAALYALGTADAAMPTHVDLTGGWRAYADEAGALRAEHILPRTDTSHVGDDHEGHQHDSDTDGDWLQHHDEEADESQGEGCDTLEDEGYETRGDRGYDGGDDEERVEGAASVLVAPDEEYLDIAATTSEDLSTLAPRVPDRVRRVVADADPALDDDVAAWFSSSCALPRLTLLGPVGARTRGVPVTKRKPYYTELLTYLATRPNGATPEEVAAAFDITPTKARGYVGTVREWLGTNPRTGQPHLPDARRSTAAEHRGVGVYQIEDLLVDADLFRRLRLRGETRGPAGIKDLQRALSLVTGQPFSKLRPGGWAWLADGDRIDQHMLCAIVDVAHLVTTHLLHTGDLTAARATAELAALAAPDEEIPRLDLAAVAAASGHHNAATDIARGDICNRTDDEGPPDQLSTRTQEVLERHGWVTGRDREAS